MSWRRVSLSLVLLSALLGAFHVLRAQEPEVNWHTNYDVARKVAREKGLPLLIDFWTDPCPHCVRLESTFSHPQIAGLLKTRFIPLKLDARVEAKLVGELNLQAYPTIIMASPDGKILKMIVGFQEVAPLHETMQRVLAGFSTPNWMEKDYQLAVKLIGSSEYAQAIVVLKRVMADGGSRSVQGQAQNLLKDLEKKGRERLDQARKLQDQGQNPEAVQALTTLMRDFPGLRVSQEASDLLAQTVRSPEFHNQKRALAAKDLLKQARDFYKNKDYSLCLDRCNRLIKGYGDLAEGQEASQLYTEIRNNPDWLQSACDTFGDRLADMWLVLADSWLKRGQPQQAKHFLNRVIRAFPGTHQAESAQIRLEQLEGTPTRRVDFQGSGEQ